jgi:threonine/homoserine/homoserine lactone efflux protein
MIRILLTFAPVAAILCLTPGAGTAMVVRSAATTGRRAALHTTIGNSLGVLTWAVLAAVGVAAVVATSVEAFTVIKLAGAVVLVILGVQTLWRGPDSRDGGPDASPSAQRNALRDGLATSLANPKLAVFFVALFPQFVPSGMPVLPAALAMAATIVAFDLLWFSTLAYAVTRVKRAFVEGPWLRRFERLTGVVLIGLGARLALERC